jgi:hypothetical protein
LQPVALLGFMSTSKVVVAVVTVLAIGGIGSAVYENAHRRETESALGAIRHERDRLQARVAELVKEAHEAGQRMRASEERVSTLQAELGAGGRRGKELARPAGESVATPNGNSAPAANVGLEMMANPEYLRLHGEKYRAEVALQFAPLYRMLRLTPEQIAKFEANRIEFQQVTQEVWSAAVAKGVSVTNPSVVNMARDPSLALEKDLIALLGDSGHKQYTQFTRARSGLDAVNTLAGSLYHSDAPLTAQQGEQLAQMMMNHTVSVPTAPGSKAIRYETDWSAITARMQDVLTPPQAAIFEKVLAAKKLQQQMAALSSATRGSAATKPGS